MHRLKSGVIHLGLIVVLLVVLTGAASVAISAGHVPTIGLFSARSPCSPFGDVNGDNRISQRDANLILRYNAGTGTIAKPERGDLNRDGRTDSRDATLIKQFLAKRITTFPVCGTSIQPPPKPNPASPSPSPTQNPAPSPTASTKFNLTKNSLTSSYVEYSWSGGSIPRGQVYFVYTWEGKCETGKIIDSKGAFRTPGSVRQYQLKPSTRYCAAITKDNPNWQNLTQWSVFSNQLFFTTPSQ